MIRQIFTKIWSKSLITDWVEADSSSRSTRISESRRARMARPTLDKISDLLKT